MKKLMITLVALFPLALFAQQKFSLQGTISNPAIEKVYLTYTTNVPDELPVKDSCAVVSGKYHFSGSVSEITFGVLNTKKPEQGIALVVLVGGDFQLVQQERLDNLLFKGSKVNDDFREMVRTSAVYQKKRALLKDIVLIEALDREMNEVIYAGYVRANPESPLAIYALRRYAGGTGELDPDKANPLFALLSDALKNSRSGQQLASEIAGQNN